MPRTPREASATALRRPSRSSPAREDVSQRPLRDQTLRSAPVPDAYRDCQRLPWFHTRPKDGSQPVPVSEVWSKLAPTRSAGSFFSFCFSSEENISFSKSFSAELPLISVVK